MGYALGYSPGCKKQIKKLCGKNPLLRDALKKKVKQLLVNPYHFKPLKKPLQNCRRVHLLKCFVLVYEVAEEQKTVRLLRLSHHDDAY